MFAPPARIKQSGRYVFLLGWERDKQGVWRAHVAWLVNEGAGWRGVQTRLRADDLEAIDGQDYRRIPRRYEEPDF